MTTIQITDLTPLHNTMLFLALPARHGTDRADIEQRLTQLGYTEITNNNWLAAYDAVREQLLSEIGERIFS